MAQLYCQRSFRSSPAERLENMKIRFGRFLFLAILHISKPVITFFDCCDLFLSSWRSQSPDVYFCCVV